MRQFKLEWEELPEELKEEKIDYFIRQNSEDYKSDLATQRAEENETDQETEFYNIREEDLLEDEDAREDAENCIRAHFPIYF